MALKKIKSADQNLNLVQDNIDQAITPLQSIPMVGGNVVEFDLVSGSDNNVPHGLQRTPQYWGLLGQSANATVWEIVASTDSSFLVLRASSNCSVKVWVN